MRRLAVFCDGTWNDEGDRTNVFQLSKLVAPTGADGRAQLATYIPGVGTQWHHRITGGTVGRGLSDNVLQGYRWLQREYREDDEIYLFGFSRGAYTARSLAGLISTCGLLRKDARLDPASVYGRYRDRKSGGTPIWQLEFLQRTGSRPLTKEETRLLEQSRRVPIRMIGVWDSVGALGIPWTGMPLIGRGRFHFHNPNLSVKHEHAFQALAIDEHRGAYKPTLWTVFVPEARDGSALNPPEIPALDRCEQRWFSGAHSNVGGGYADDILQLRPLAWLQSRAQGLGLAFTSAVAADDGEFDRRPVDSYTKFLFGGYRVLKLWRRYFRPIGVECNKVKGGWSYPINETIDGSVFERCRRDPNYARDNLLDWAQRQSSVLTDMTGTRHARSGGAL